MRNQSNTENSLLGPYQMNEPITRAVKSGAIVHTKKIISAAEKVVVRTGLIGIADFTRQSIDALTSAS